MIILDSKRAKELTEMVKAPFRDICSWLSDSDSSKSMDKSKPASLRAADAWNATRELMRWTARDPVLYRDAYEHFLITGRTGSAKTTSSGAEVACSFLAQKWGGLVLCAKSSEKDTWIKYALQTGRLQDLVIFAPGEPWYFDPLAFECSRQGAGAAQTETLVSLFEEIVQAAERTAGASGMSHGQSEEAFWRRTLRQLLRNLIDLMILAGDPVSVPILCRLLLSAPRSLEEAASVSFKAQSSLYGYLKRADERPKTRRERMDLEAVAAYWLNDYPALSEKTRSIVVTSFTAAADGLNRGLLRSLFGRGESNLTPADIERGKIVVVDLSAKEYSVLGILAGVLWKTAFMRHIERRNVASSPVGCFLWIDEAGTYVTAGDAQFVSTARSARVSVVLLVQSLPVFVDALGGGDKGRAAADALCSNLATRIHHCNGCAVTNQWVSDGVGKRRALLSQFSAPSNRDVLGDLAGGSGSGESTGNVSFSESLQPELDTSLFTTLRTGGEENGYLADAIVVRTGRTFAGTDRTWAKLTFSQRG